MGVYLCYCVWLVFFCWYCVVGLFVGVVVVWLVVGLFGVVDVLVGVGYVDWFVGCVVFVGVDGDWLCWLDFVCFVDGVGDLGVVYWGGCFL